MPRGGLTTARAVSVLWDGSMDVPAAGWVLQAGEVPEDENGRRQMFINLKIEI